MSQYLELMSNNVPYRQRISVSASGRSYAVDHQHPQWKHGTAKSMIAPEDDRKKRFELAESSQALKTIDACVESEINRAISVAGFVLEYLEAPAPIGFNDHLGRRAILEKVIHSLKGVNFYRIDADSFYASDERIRHRIFGFDFLPSTIKEAYDFSVIEILKIDHMLLSLMPDLLKSPSLSDYDRVITLAESLQWQDLPVKMPEGEDLSWLTKTIGHRKADGQPTFAAIGSNLKAYALGQILGFYLARINNPHMDLMTSDDGILVMQGYLSPQEKSRIGFYIAKFDGMKKNQLSRQMYGSVKPLVDSIRTYL
jgi:hypothetical protein